MHAKGQAPRFGYPKPARLIKVLPMPLNENSRKAIFRHSNVGIGISAVSITRASKPSLIEWVMVPRVLWKGIQGWREQKYTPVSKSDGEEDTESSK